MGRVAAKCVSEHQGIGVNTTFAGVRIWAEVDTHNTHTVNFWPGIRNRAAESSRFQKPNVIDLFKHFKICESSSSSSSSNIP